MKKNQKITFVLFILTGLATVATAQTEKGNFLLSGSGSLDFTAKDNLKQFFHTI